MASRTATFGALFFALPLAGLGALELWRGAALPGLHALLEIAGAMPARGAGALVLLTALLMIAGPLVRPGAAAAAALWSAFFVAALIAASLNPADATGWVSASECATFAAACRARSGGARSALLLRLVFGATILWFGVVHLTHPDIIASLIPDWIAYREQWPWLTGGVLGLAGLACLAGRAVTWAAGAVALMFAAWLPLVHAGRIAADPGDLFEWTFALTAAALTGVALLAASRFAETPREG
ncbi:hypothetical protein [Terricaulis sp.]|uniref:hypothetical protein n=1 Tax=Terricaulis sp. TaxID=2768686 RepID=UPI0037830CE0